MLLMRVSTTTTRYVGQLRTVTQKCWMSFVSVGVWGLRAEVSHAEVAGVQENDDALRQPPPRLLVVTQHTVGGPSHDTSEVGNARTVATRGRTRMPTKRKMDVNVH